MPRTRKRRREAPNDGKNFLLREALFERESGVFPVSPAVAAIGPLYGQSSIKKGYERAYLSGAKDQFLGVSNTGRLLLPICVTRTRMDVCIISANGRSRSRPLAENPRSLASIGLTVILRAGGWRGRPHRRGFFQPPFREVQIVLSNRLQKPGGHQVNSGWFENEKGLPVWPDV